MEPSSNSNNLNRSDGLRKSLRLHSIRKGLAPAPPTTLTSNDGIGVDEEVQLRRPSATVTAPVPLERSTIMPKISLSTITRPERSAISLMVIENKPKSIVPSKELLGEEDDANVSFALGSIEKHINQVEESFKYMKNEESQASIDELQVELIRKSKRYCETENLLHPVGSEMASENDFQYLRGNENLETDVDLKPQEFQRNSDIRSSMGAAYTAGKLPGGNLTQRPKIARTASDTKNTDVLAMRAMIKQKQQLLPHQQQVVTTTQTQGTNVSTSVVDGNASSTSNTTTTKRISQRTREENLRHFEALLAAHKATRNAGNANATTTTTGTRVVHVAPRPIVTPVLDNNNKPLTVALAPITTPTKTQAQQQQHIGKQHIISPSSTTTTATTNNWKPPLVIGNRNNNRLALNNNNTTTNNNNNMPQVINKRVKQNKHKRTINCNYTLYKPNFLNLCIHNF